MTTESKWRMERENEDDGTISYCVWSSDPEEWLFTIHGSDTPNAKAIATLIVKAVNAYTEVEK